MLNVTSCYSLISLRARKQAAQEKYSEMKCTKCKSAIKVYILHPI